MTSMQAAIDSLSWLQDAPPVRPADWDVIMNVLEQAKKKFNEYDTSDVGHISVKEAGMLTDWAWAAFHVENESIANSAKKNEVAKVIRALESHRDQQMYMDQFEKYFTCTAEAVCRFRTKNAQRMATANAMGKFQIMVEEEKMLHDSTWRRLVKDERRSEQHSKRLFQAMHQLRSSERVQSHVHERLVEVKDGKRNAS